PAPPGLITPAMAAKAASLTLAGGFLLNIKVVAALVVIAGSATAYLTMGAIRRSTTETSATGTDSRRPHPMIVDAGTRPARPLSTVLAAAPAEESVLNFASSLAYARALEKAMFLESNPDRWRALRRMGFALTDDE